MIGDLPLAAQIAIAFGVAIVWFCATCFLSGVLLGLMQAWREASKHVRAIRANKFYE